MEPLWKLQILVFTYHLLYTCSWEWHQAYTTQFLEPSVLSLWRPWMGKTAQFHTLLTQGWEWGRPPGSVEGSPQLEIWFGLPQPGWDQVSSPGSHSGLICPPPELGFTDNVYEGSSFLAVHQNHLVISPLPGSHLQRFCVSAESWWYLGIYF